MSRVSVTPRSPKSSHHGGRKRLSTGANALWYLWESSPQHPQKETKDTGWWCCFRLSTQKPTWKPKLRIHSLVITFCLYSYIRANPFEQNTVFKFSAKPHANRISWCLKLWPRKFTGAGEGVIHEKITRRWQIQRLFWILLWSGPLCRDQIGCWFWPQNCVYSRPQDANQSCIEGGPSMGFKPNCRSSVWEELVWEEFYFMLTQTWMWAVHGLSKTQICGLFWGSFLVSWDFCRKFFVKSVTF